MAQEGWGFPLNSKKAHYFVDQMSLCGKWWYHGEGEQGNDDSPNNCKICRKRLDARRGRL